MQKNVILIGMPSSGKTTVGTRLSEVIGYGYIDSDSVIIARYGKLLKDLIADLGNEGYLDVEAKVNSEIAASRCVIATGGSAVYRDNAMQKLKENEHQMQEHFYLHNSIATVQTHPTSATTHLFV